MHIDAERGAQSANSTQHVDLAPDSGVGLQCKDSVNVGLCFQHICDAPVHHDMDACLGNGPAQQRERRSR